MQITTRSLTECGNSENLKNLILELEHLLYGFNYQVTLGVALLPLSPTLDDCKNTIVSIFNDADPDDHHNLYGIQEWSESDFWEEVDFGFAYRGDRGSGLELSQREEKKLSSMVAEYKNWINAYISPKSQLYYYPSTIGIPGYPVFWDYRVIIVNTDRESLFVYGSSSD